MNTRTPIDDVASAFVDSLLDDPTLSARSVRWYGGDLADAVRFLKGRGVRTLNAATTDDLVAYRAKLDERRASAHTIARRFRTLRRFFRFAIEAGATRSNLAREVETPKAWQAKRRRPAPRATEEMVRAIRGRDPTDLRDKALLAVAVATGASPRDVVGLTERDVDLERGLVKIGPETRKIDARTAQLVRRYQDARDEYLDGRTAGALWVSFARRSRGRKLSTRSIYDILAARAVA